jgi:hypothetical protein
MSKPSKIPKRNTPLPRTEPCPDAIVIQSHGMGVESQAILERWVAEPESRPFVTWDQLIVVTAQVGEEHKKDTIRDCEARMLPLLRQHGVRFVELARRGFHEEDGIVVLQDTREPTKLHPDGAFSLSQYLMRSGTVPQFGGEHRCAMKFKAFVIETWLALEFQHLELTKPVYHVFGYNSEETTRTDKSEYHIQRHNADKLIPAPKPPLMVFGFNSEEVSRVERSMLYDGPSRTGHYPLDEWGWDRAKCIGYILQQAGTIWRKSACSFCLAGDTMVMARGGPIAIRDLVGKSRQLLIPRRDRPDLDHAVCNVDYLDAGEWAGVPVRSFGVQKLVHLRWENSRGVFFDVHATAEHRWPVRGIGMVASSELKPGHQVQHVFQLNDPGAAYRNSLSFFTLCFVEDTDREEEVFCATVESVGAFVLASGMVTGNCPFCAEATKGEPDAVRRWEESPEDTAKGMLVEYNSLCFNPRGHLYRDRALQDVVNRIGVTAVQEAFARKLAEIPWALYRVRRIYTKKGKAMRHVEKLTPSQTRAFADASLKGVVARDAPFATLEVKRDISYWMFARREENVYPTREGYYVVAPAFMDDKLRGKPEKFNERWEQVGLGLPLNSKKKG